MQTALQRPSQQQHSQFFPAELSARQQSDSITATRPSRAGSVSAQGFMASAEDSDNIDDILNSLWPTGSTPLAAAIGTATALTTANQPQIDRVSESCFRFPKSRPPPPHPSQQYAGSGQHTPPEYDACGRVPFSIAMLPSQTKQPPPPPATSASYTLVATPPPPALTSTPKLHCGQQKSDVAFAHGSIPSNSRLLARSVSSSIQIGDPEWRVDSPQSIVRASPMYMHSIPGKLPSPVSPTMHIPVLQQDCVTQGLPHNDPQPMQYRRGSAAAAMHSQPSSLGIGNGGGIRTSRSASTLGLLPRNTGAKLASAVPSSPRKLTPEERVARLHTVSGLAARAVARRCLSGQLPALDADAMLRQAGAVARSMPTAMAANKKLTFADVAKGSQTQHNSSHVHNGQH
ncbi:hypothetical protein GGI23_005078 [Coemansia sp. RSA 2559]|nr:hypothetical protein GGI23_005078 [Coemansia sp. RSA 2559]KAJ2858786.1 hypothetical protein GGI22_003236 [Coemansia erecta]